MRFLPDFQEKPGLSRMRSISNKSIVASRSAGSSTCVGFPSGSIFVGIPVSYEIRTSNLDYNDASVQKIELRPGRDAELTSTARITNPGTPWVMVVIPDGLLNEHREVTGSTRATK